MLAKIANTFPQIWTSYFQNVDIIFAECFYLNKFLMEVVHIGRLLLFTNQIVNVARKPRKEGIDINKASMVRHDHK